MLVFSKYSDLDTSPPKLWAQFVWHCLQGKATGKQLLFLIKECSFSRYVCLVLLSPSWKHAQQSSHHSHTELWQNWQAAAPSRALNNKTFLYHVFLCKYKRVPLHLSTRLFSPMFPAECKTVVLVSHMELRDVLRCRTKKAYNPAGITSCFWSLKWPVSLFLPPLKKQASSLSK